MTAPSFPGAERQAVPLTARRPGPADLMPPLALPLEHFAAAAAWLLLGALGLVVVAPELSAGVYLAPHVIAVTHAFTLGWILTSVMGALYQLGPVALGVEARSAAAGHATFWLLTCGVASVVGGVWTWMPAIAGGGWLLIALAVGVFGWNVLSRMGDTARGATIGNYVGGAFLMLVAGLLVSGARLGNAAGWWAVDREALLLAHVHLALAGFATLTAVGVGSRLFPMFLLSRGQPEWPMAWIGPLVTTALSVLVAGALTGIGLGVTAGGVLLAIAIAIYLYQAAQYYRLRSRPQLDPGLMQVAIALLFLASAVVLGLALLFLPGPAPRLATAYGVAALIGWLALLIAGISSKILPFLTWLHRFSPRVGQPDTPKVGDLLHPALARASVAFMSGGALVLVGGILAGSMMVTRAGSLAYAAGTVTLLLQHGRLALPPRHLRPAAHA